MSNHTMKAIALYLRQNFENKLSEVHDLELKYLTSEQDPITKIINLQSLCYSCFFRVSCGFAASTAGTYMKHVMINLGFHFFSVNLQTFSFILYIISV